MKGFSVLLAFLFVIGSLSASAISAEVFYDYSAKCRLLPEAMALEGSCTVSYSVIDPLMASSILIYASKEPDNDRFYYSKGAAYNEDPIKERDNADWIELHELVVDGDTVDLSSLKQEDVLLRYRFKEKKKPGSRVTVKTRFTTHIVNYRDNLVFLLDPWLPIVATDSDKDLVEIPNHYEYSITLPADYRLVASGFIESDSLEGGDRVYRVTDPNISVPYWVASPRIKMIESDDEPIRYRIYSACGPYPEGAIDELREQVEKMYDFFGSPVGDRQDLSFILMPIHMSGLGGANGGNIVFINRIYYKSSILSHFYPHLFLHELLHYWFMNRVFGKLTEADFNFHECFVRNTTAMLSRGSLAVERKRRVKGVSRWFTFLSRVGSLIDMSPQRGGYHFSIFKSKNVGEIPKAEKGAAALNSISLQFPLDQWEQRVLRYFKAVKEKRPITFDLFCRQNRDIAPYLKSWFEEPKDFDYAVGRVESRPLGAGQYESMIEIVNKGGIVSPCPVQITYEDGSSEMKTIATGKVDTITETTDSPVREVMIDPAHIVPDYDRSNDSNRAELRFRASFFPRRGDERTVVMSVMPLPMYSEQTGWNLSSNILSLYGATRSFGAAGNSMDAMTINLGYNFREQGLVWNAHIEKSIGLLPGISTLYLKALDDPEMRLYSIRLKSKSSRSFNDPPIRNFSIFVDFKNLYRPSYRERPDWTTGYNLFVGTTFGWKNTKTLLYPVKGNSLHFSAGKGFDVAGGDWDYEKFSAEAADYRLMPFITILANRLFVGEIRGGAPIQERFDVAKDALFSSYPVYERNGYRIIALDSELRIRKRLPVFDTAIFVRNAWLQDYGESDLRHASELGFSLRTNILKVSLDLTLLRRGFDGSIDHRPAFQIKVGEPFGYSQIRYVSRGQ